MRPMTKGQRIKALRKKRGFPTQQEFANALGVHTSTVSRWESGAVDVPQGMLRGIAATFDMTMHGMLRGVDS